MADRYFAEEGSLGGEKEKTAMRGDTLRAFNCCVCKPPECEKCPLCNDSPEYECKETLKHSVRDWLMRAIMLDNGD